MRQIPFEERVASATNAMRQYIESVLTWAFTSERATYVLAMKVTNPFGLSSELVQVSNVHDEDAADLLEEALDDLEPAETGDEPADAPADARCLVINLSGSAEKAEVLQRRCDDLEKQRAILLQERDQLLDNSNKMLQHLGSFSGHAGAMLGAIELALCEYAPSSTRDYDARGRQLYAAVAEAVGHRRQDGPSR